MLLYPQEVDYLPNKIYGDPTLTIRLPSHQIAQLKILARENETTVSAIIREMIDAYLDAFGHDDHSADQLPGQMFIDDLDA